MRCYNCGGFLATIDHGGCGGNGGVAGCDKCDAVYRMEGGGIISDSHPVLDRYSKFSELRYRRAREISPHHLNEEWNKNYPDTYGKWVWCEVGDWPVHYTDTEAEAKEQISAYIKKLHDGLNWPLCDKCGKKPETKYGVGDCFICKDCSRVCYGTQWFDRKQV